MRRILTIIAIFLVGVAFGLVLSHGPLNAQNANNDSDIMSRLNDITKTQQELMEAVNSIKEDVQIIKVRVTQMQ